MRFSKIIFLIAALAGLAACGNKSANIKGSWKVVDLVLSPDSLNHSPEFDKSPHLKLQFIFNEDNTMEITDGTSPGEQARYSLEDSGKDRYLVMRPLANQRVAQGAPMEQRMRIVQLTSAKLDLEQRFGDVTATTRLESIPQ